MKTVVKLEQDENGDVVLPLSDEICKQLDLNIGDKLSYNFLPGGKIEIKKAPLEVDAPIKKKLIMVESISSFRMRYLIEVDENSENNLQEFVRNEIDSGFPNLKEFTQTHVGEVVIGQRDVSQLSLEELADEDGDNGVKLNERINKIE